MPCAPRTSTKIKKLLMSIEKRERERVGKQSNGRKQKRKKIEG